MVIRFFFNDEFAPIDSIVLMDGENCIVKHLLRVSKTERCLIVDVHDSDIRLIKENEWKDESSFAHFLGMIMFPYANSPFEGNLLPYSFEVVLSSKEHSNSISIPDDVTIITDEKSVNRWKVAVILSFLTICLALAFVCLVVACVSKEYIGCTIAFILMIVAMVLFALRKNKRIIHALNLQSKD